jgi:hypothetical protein
VLGAQREVQEAGARDDRLGDDVVGRQALRERGRDVTRIPLERTCERESGVGLVVGVGGAMDGGIDGRGLVAEGVADRGLDTPAQRGKQIDGHCPRANAISPAGGRARDAGRPPDRLRGPPGRRSRQR